MHPRLQFQRPQERPQFERVQVLKLQIELKDCPLLKHTAHTAVLVIPHIPDPLVFVPPLCVLAGLVTMVTVELAPTQLGVGPVVGYPPVRSSLPQQVELGGRRLGGGKDGQDGVETALVLLKHPVGESHPTGVSRAHVRWNPLALLRLVHPAKEAAGGAEQVILCARMQLTRQQLTCGSFVTHARH